MTNFPDYFRATNEAYLLLSEYTGKYPVIDILSIFSKMPYVKIHTFSECADKLSLTVSEFLQIAPSDYGFSIYDKRTKKWLVFYNDLKSNTTIRFTLAHELGHIVLNHTCDDNISQSEANCFGRNLLCPVPIRKAFHLKKISDYCSCFDISEPMAEATMGNDYSDSYYITQENFQKVDNNIYCYFSGYSLAELYGYSS